MKMGLRLRCSSVRYRSRYAPSSRLAGRPILIATKATLFMGQDTRRVCVGLIVIVLVLVQGGTWLKR